MNVTGGTRFSGPRRIELENYFPAAHYRKALDQAFEALAEERLETDGGKPSNIHTDGRRSTAYYWLNPDTGAALYHTTFNGDEANLFFPSVGEAERFLEQQAQRHDQERYQGMSLYKAKVSKVEDAVEVLMDQSGINDFAP